MDQVQSIPNQSHIPKNGQASGKFSDPGPSNPQNSDRLWADFGPSNPQNRGQPYIRASGGLLLRCSHRGRRTALKVLAGIRLKGTSRTDYLAATCQWECPQPRGLIEDCLARALYLGAG